MEKAFSGLDKFGLSKIIEEKNDIFESVEEKTISQKKVNIFKIEDYVYAKKFTCPVCHKNFTSNIVRDSKLRVESISFDLCPKYSPVNPNLYNIVICQDCGYSADKLYFNKITSRQANLILEKIKPSFKPHSWPLELSIDMAIERYKLALVTSMVKNAKNGERAYLCLKLMWLYREKNDTEHQKLFASFAAKGFEEALLKESLPIMGLSESTLTYILATIYQYLANYEKSLKFLSDVIISKTASERLKDRARELKNKINGKNLTK